MTASPATLLRNLSKSLGPRPRTRQLLGARAFLIPIAIVVFVIFLFPLAQSFYYSLTDFNGYSPDLNFVGIDNYVRVFSDASMLSALGFTVLYAVSTLVIVTVLAIPLAMIFNRVFFGRRFVQSALFFPAIPSLAILGLVWGFIFNPLGSGALNSLLGGLFGIAPIPWLSVDQLAQFSVVVVAIWSLTGWHAMLYLAYLQAIPHDFTEAAMMDGASARQRFFHITLPMLTPAVTVSSLLLLTSGIKVYELPFALTKGGPGFATRTLTQSIIQSGVAQGKFGEGSALSVVFLVLVGSIVLAQLAIARRIEGRIQ
jgi:ABC-type sugar transport system permease subunit